MSPHSSIRKWQIFVLASLVGAVLPASIAFAQNACSQIFSTSFSAEVIDQKVTDLARLKLHLDQTAAGGEIPSLAVTKLQNDFISTFHELLQRSGLSEKEFKDLVKKKVAEIQSKRLEEIALKEQDRARQEKTNTAYRTDIKLQKTSELPLRWSDRFYSFGVISTSKELFYLDKTNSMSRKLMALDINSGKHTRISEAEVVLAETSADGRSLMYLDKNWILHILDTKTGIFSHEVKLDTKDVTPRRDFDDFRGIDVSPSGDRVVLSGNFIVVFNLQTGEKISVTDAKTQHSQYINWVRFIDNDNVTFASDNNIFIYNIPRQSRSTVELNEMYKAIQGLDVSLDKQSISIVTTVSRFTYDLNLNMTVQKSSDGQYAQYIRVPSYASLVFEKSVGITGPRLYEQSSQAEVFDFGKNYDFKKIEDRVVRGHFNASASELYMIVIENGKYRLDIWEQ